METIEFRILGPLEVVHEGRLIGLGGTRQRALLALLLTRANEVVSTDRLIDELWGSRAPKAAANALQYHVSRLRKTLPPRNLILTKEPGYLIRVGPDELDLLRFDRLIEQAQHSPPQLAATFLREALDLWRGPALADFAHESFAEAEIHRLEELRLAAVELRVDAELALGSHPELVAELDMLVREHPLRERFRAQLMLALYGAGRQVEALGVYRATRLHFVEELGIEPSPALQALEQAILRQDPDLSPQPSALPQPQRTIVVVLDGTHGSDQLLAIAEPLARRPRRELILTRLLRDDARLAVATQRLAERRRTLEARGVSARIAAYTTAEPGADAARLAIDHDADLLLVEGPLELLEGGQLGEELATILARSPCDVGVLVSGEPRTAGPVVTPFGGTEHDWSAIEIAGWLARSLETTLRLAGTQADAAIRRRDASRLLARASLVVQRVIGIVTEPVLVPAGPDGMLEAAHDARLLVLGLSDRWPMEGIGAARLAVAAGTPVPTLFVRRGIRPSGVAPPESITRFTWSIGAEPIRSAT